jgi:O-antigen/teichoic acid export membrane protein
MAIVIGVAVALASPWMASHWLQPDRMTTAEVTHALQLIALSLALQWPSLLYGAVVLALHRQAESFRVMAPVMLVQAAGAAAVLWLVGPDIHAFLLWQAVLFGIGSILMGRIAWRAMPRAEGAARFDLPLLRSVWRFAAGSFFIGICASLLGQADKVVMARVLTLDAFAGYALAYLLVQQASSLLMAPVSVAVYPHLSALVAAGDETRLREEYLRWSEVMSLVAFTALGTLAVFPAPPLQLWLGAASPLVEPVLALLPWILLGSVLGNLFVAPNILMLVGGMVRPLAIYSGVTAAAYCIALWVLAPHFGAMTGPGLGFVLAIGGYVVMLPRLHRRLLRGQAWTWFVQTVLRPGILAVIVLGTCRWVLPATSSRWWGLAEAAFSASLVLVAMLIVLPRARADALRLSRIMLGWKG